MSFNNFINTEPVGYALTVYQDLSRLGSREDHGRLGFEQAINVPCTIDKPNWLMRFIQFFYKSPDERLPFIVAKTLSFFESHFDNSKERYDSLKILASIINKTRNPDLIERYQKILRPLDEMMQQIFNAKKEKLQYEKQNQKLIDEHETLKGQLQTKLSALNHYNQNETTRMNKLFEQDVIALNQKRAEVSNAKQQLEESKDQPSLIANLKNEKREIEEKNKKLEKFISGATSATIQLYPHDGKIDGFNKKYKVELIISNGSKLDIPKNLNLAVKIKPKFNLSKILSE